MSRKYTFIQPFDKILLKHHFLRIMCIGNGPKMTHFSCLIFDVILLSDVISSIGPKISDAVTNFIDMSDHANICPKYGFFPMKMSCTKT